MAARPDAHARVRVGGALPLRARASKARVRRGPLVAAEVSADGSAFPHRRAGARDQARAVARDLSAVAAPSTRRAPHARRPDPGLPLGRGGGTQALIPPLGDSTDDNPGP